MPIDLFESVTECGCAAKVPAADLAGLLRGLDLPSSDAVIVGPDTLDDAGVYRLPDGRCLVQTVDFFPPVARDPFDYGRIAAANALSDVYAMGATPLTALAVACFPSALVRGGAFAEALRGVAGALREAGCVLLGGHSILDPQPKLGLAVTGVASPDDLFTNAAARPGDVLILTKPIGTGVTIMAVRAGMATQAQEAEAIRVMASLNRAAASIAARCGVRCATDVTGFGLLGHALQLARASGVSLAFVADDVPGLDGALEFADQGLLSAAAYSNRAYVGDAVRFSADVPLAAQDLLCDPVTSGGLLACCPADRVDEFLALARAEIPTGCAVVGQVLPPGDRPILDVRRHL